MADLVMTLKPGSKNRDPIVYVKAGTTWTIKVSKTLFTTVPDTLTISGDGVKA